MIPVLPMPPRSPNPSFVAIRPASRIPLRLADAERDGDRYLLLEPVRLGLLLGVVLLACQSVYGADDIDLYRARDTKGYFVRASAKALFHVGVSVETVRPAYGSGEYANGYVVPDIGGSQDLTWNWGYDSDTQVVGDQLNFYRYDDLPPLGTQTAYGVAPGGEIMAGLTLGSFKLGKRTVTYGVEGGYGFNYLSVNTDSSGNSMVTYRTATYNLNGVIPPSAPYAGTAEGPGPLIGLVPVDTQSAGPVSSTAVSSGELTSGLHNFKLGVWLDYPINDALFTSLSLGYASIYADAQYEFTETLTPATSAVPGYTSTQTVGGRDSWEPGFYAQWRMGFHASKHVDLFLGLDYQWNNNMTFSGADRNVTLDFGAMFGASAGVQLSF